MSVKKVTDLAEGYPPGTRDVRWIRDAHGRTHQTSREALGDDLTLTLPTRAEGCPPAPPRAILHRCFFPLFRCG
jgi:hypothetical protein